MRVKQKSCKLSGGRLLQTFSFYYKGCLFVGSCAETNHKLAFCAPQREQHVCLGGKNKLLNSGFSTVNSGFIFAEGKPAKIHSIAAE